MPANENYDSEFDEEEPKFKKITIKTDYKIKTSLEEPPTDLELKPLPDNLEYVFLEEPSFLPVIISSQLSAQNKSKLISILKKHKEAFSWKTTDIPGICPSFYKHKIQLLDDKKPVVQKQRSIAKMLILSLIEKNVTSWSKNELCLDTSTAYKTPTGTTPYKLIYGKNYHLPFEIEHRAYWALKNCNPDLIAADEKRMFQLHKLDELRHQAYENSRLYKARTKVWHDRNLRMRKEFKHGNKRGARSFVEGALIPQSLPGILIGTGYSLKDEKQSQTGQNRERNWKEREKPRPKDTDSDNDSVFRPKTDQIKPKSTKINFIKSDENVKSINKENTHKQEEYPRKIQSPRDNRRNWNGMMNQKLGNGFEFIKKACFVCGSFNHLIKDYDFHDNKMVEKPVLNNKGRVTGQREIRPVWNNAQRVNHQNKFTHPHPKRNFVPTTVVTKSEQVPVNNAKQSSPRVTTSISTAKPVNTAAPKSKKNDALPKTYSYFKAHSLGNPQYTLKDQGIFGSRCSRHMTRNKSFLTDYQEVDGGFVAFAGSLKGGKITGKGKIRTGNVLFTETECIVLSPDFKLLDESQVLLKVPRHNNMYSFDLKSVVPSGSLTCLFAKATIVETNLWHKRLGHINFKTMNKLVKGNLVRGPSINTASININTGSLNINIVSPNDPNMPSLEETGIFDRAYDDEDVGAEADLNNLETTMNVIQALTDPSWIEAMQKELLQFKLQKVWTLVDLPKGKRAIGTKWVYRNKKDKRGIVVRNKARLVAQGYTQEERINYDEVFAPVARIEAIRLFLAYASFIGLIVYQMDVEEKVLGGGTFYMVLLQERCYVCQPPGFKDPQFPDKVYKVEKALYVSLLQAPRGLKENGIFISQDKYVADILKKFDFTIVKEASTPIETNKALNKDEEAKDVDVHLYRSMIGSLMYLTASMPDIMFAVCACARDSPFDLEAFSDSDYAGASLDRKSTTGGCQFLGKRLISWQCKKQTIVANSTTEAEYVAAANCCGQVLWIQNQMLDYGFNFMNTKIYIDNESTICIVKNPVFHSKTKHIEIRHHFIRDSYEKKLIQVIKIHTDQNVADLLTKAFDVSRFNFLVASIGLLNL
ncbi:putative reverse transcriptase, RNA-dependent DNA polymerase [Tanacetum coccineum]